MKTSRIAKGLFWKTLERFGMLGSQFITQVILARLLAPEDYGAIAIMLVFIAIANVFIQTGFNTSLIQNKEVDEEDYSSVYIVTLFVAILMYLVIYFAVPVIAKFYDMPDIIEPFRIIAIVLFPGALQSVQTAKVSREMDFKKIFYSNVGAIIISGVIGIFMAYAGFGIWALVFQTVLNSAFVCIIMWFIIDWHPKLVCNFDRVKTLFSFGWKLMIASLLENIYQSVFNLVIGKKYNASELGYYDRGRQFPQVIISAINTSIQTVMLPAMSEEQSDKEKVRMLMRTSIVVSSYIIFPMMAGLAGIAAPLVEILLTSKWIPCVPYLQIYCFAFAFYPVHTCNLQAINAIGRSDVYLKLEILKKLTGIILLVISVYFFDSAVVVIAVVCVSTTIVSCFINASPSKKLVGYSYIEQMKDIFPAFILALFMFICVSIIKYLEIGPILMIVVQVICGCIVYGALSHLLKLRAYQMSLNIVKSLINNRQK